MFRFLVALALFRLLAQSAGLDLLVDARDPCCEESGSGGNCSPACEDCACCPHQRPATLADAVAVPAPAVAVLEVAEIGRPVTDPRPHDIFRVPKRRFSV